MLEVMTRVTVSWEEISTVWPWSRVLRARDTIATDRYYSALPSVRLAYLYQAANTKPGTTLPKLHEWLPPQVLPPALREGAGLSAKAIYEPEMIRAYELGRKLGFIGNAHLAAFGSEELRASGWGRNT